jgi:hypothetical protein
LIFGFDQRFEWLVKGELNTELQLRLKCWDSTKVRGNFPKLELGIATFPYDETIYLGTFHKIDTKIFLKIRVYNNNGLAKECLRDTY